MKENKILLEKYLDGNCTKEELRLVNQLLSTEEGNRMLFELFKQPGMEELKNPPQESLAAKELTKSRRADLLQRMSEQKQSHRRPFLSRPLLRYGGIAAVFAGVIILSGIFLMNSNNGTGLFGSKEQVIAYAELHELPDGTQIWLAAGSTLKYPEEFDKKHRDVGLTGEGFFDVERDEKRPFTIHSGEMETRVLGTSFKVTAFEGQEQEVSVATGKVSVSNNGQELALLTRGLQVRHNPETGETTQAEIDPTILEEWKSGV